MLYSTWFERRGLDWPLPLPFLSFHDSLQPCTILSTDFLFQTQEYWDQRFEEEENYEWLLSFEKVEAYILPHLKTTDHILVIGCGNSTLSNDLYDRGYCHIKNIDFSRNVIEKMSRLSRELGHAASMRWIEMDMLDMAAFDDDSFDVVLDKATMDAIM